MKTRDYFHSFTTVKRLFCFNAVLLACAFMVSCSEQEGPELEGDNYSITDIAGNWTATQAMFTSTEIPNKGSVDVIGLGGSMTLSIQNNGRFAITIKLPGEADQELSGQLGFDEEWLAVSYDEDPGEYDYFFIELNDSETVLTLRGEGTYDFDDDGLEDLAGMDFILARN